MLVDWVHISWLMLNIRAKVAVIQVVFDSYQYLILKDWALVLPISRGNSDCIHHGIVLRFLWSSPNVLKVALVLKGCFTCRPLSLSPYRYS